MALYNLPIRHKADYWPETRRVINIKTVTSSRFQNFAVISALICSILTFILQPPALATSATAYNLGDLGPGGGRIFYYSSTGFNCGPMASDLCNYLEAAPSGWNTGSDPLRLLADNNLSPSAVQESAIGSGYKNSLAIIAAGYSDPATYAAKLSRDYSGGGKSDWYLPSKDELNQMCKWVKNQTGTPDATVCTSSGAVNTGVGATGFSDLDEKGNVDSSDDEEVGYWSSTNSSNIYAAWYQIFRTGDQATQGYQANSRFVRPIRAFSVPTTVISVAAIGGVTAPVRGGTPVSTVTSANGYTGTVSWSGSPQIFAASETYTATITLTAASGYTLSGVTANFFTVSGATTVTHDADSGVIRAVFPATAGKSSQTVTWAPTTALTIIASPATPSALATTSGDGAISYAVTSAGTTGCSVNSSTGVLTYIATGNCQVTATAASTTNYESATAVVTFSIALASRTLTMDTSGLRPVYLTVPYARNNIGTIRLTAVASAGTGTITYRAGNARGSWGCSMGRGFPILFIRTAVGLPDHTCVVTATIAADSNYAQAQVSVSFPVKTPFSVTIRYSPNGATGTPEKLIDRLDYDRSPGVTLPGVGTMVKPGYTFAGWSESGSTPVLTGTYENHLDVTLKAVGLQLLTQSLTTPMVAIQRRHKHHALSVRHLTFQVQ